MRSSNSSQAFGGPPLVSGSREVLTCPDPMKLMKVRGFFAGGGLEVEEEEGCFPRISTRWFIPLLNWS